MAGFQFDPIPVANPLAARAQGERDRNQNRLLALQQELTRTQQGNALATREREATVFEQEQHRELLDTIAEGVELADTPEKWSRLVDYFVADGHEGAEQYRHRFADRDLIRAEVAAARGGARTEPYVLSPGAALVNPSGDVLHHNPARAATPKAEAPATVTMQGPKGQFVDLKVGDRTIEARKRLGWAVVGEPSQAPVNAPPAPEATPAAAAPAAAPDEAATLQHAREAIAKGADPKQVAERLKSIGVDPAKLTTGTARGVIRRDITRPLD